ncbi:alpha/beta hydrolase [Kutzneria viridogrisea]|uniref:Uncharacterized protein n=1 Tax=Kutzneria albida DSM 43870 TaxID=1449976 RepID=W5WCZ3_9PSEU|nr:hypothetical protein KALB_5350 [Kutzneria albida DSM 43870]
MFRRKLLVGVVVTAAAASVTVGTAAAAQGGSGPDWSPCTDLQPLECTTIAVPMDYSRPDGPQLTLALSRLKAKEPEHRRGVLFTNPGGPGGEGRELPTGYADDPIAKVYDLIGIDVRGLGGSTQLNCEVPGVAAPETTRPSDQQFRQIAEAERQWEAGCQRGGGELRQYVTTANTARDMDRVRQALGEEKINYLGVSYGTWLGAVYGQLFPEHLDRSVLDSSLDPTTTWHDQAYDVVDTIKANFGKWAAWAADRDGTFRLGNTPRKVRASVDKIAAALATKPVGGLANQSELDLTVGQFTRYRQSWAPLAKQLQKTLAELPLPTGDPKLAESNRRAAAAAGQLAAKAKTENGVYRSVVCEWAWPTNLDGYYRDMRRVRDDFPYGNTVSQMAPNNCAFHRHQGEPLPRIGRAQYGKGLVLASDGDTQTPLANGEAMARTLGSTLIAVHDEGQHGQYSAGPSDPNIPVKPNTCVNEKVNAYLIDGRLPAGNRVDCATANPPAAVPTDPAPGVLDSIEDLGHLAEQLLHTILPHSAR